MKKLFLLLCLSLCLFNTALAEEVKEAETKAPAAATEEQQQEAKEKADVKVLLTAEDVQQQMQQGINNNCYLEIEDGKFIAYNIDTKDGDTRRDLFKKAPAERVNHLQTNNEEIYNYLTKFIQSREKSGRKYYGYRITGGVEENAALPDGSTVYKFWFMKLDEDDGGGFRVPIGIGIGIGGGHHHGPWIGVGW